MNDFLWRAGLGVCFTICAWGLVHIGQPIPAVLPAGAGVYILGSVLLDALRRNY